MCCLFGFIDYAGVLSVTQKNRLIRELSIAAEALIDLRAAPMPPASPTTHHVGCKSISVRWRRIGCIYGFLRRPTWSWGIRG